MMPLNHFHCYHDQPGSSVGLFAESCLLEDYDRRVDSAPNHRLHKSAEVYLSSLKAGSASIRREPDRNVNFTELPVGVHLHLFSYLTAPSLTALAQTCSYLNELSSDPILWSRLLTHDCQSWSVLGHLSYPKTYHDAHTDLTPKQIYQQCYIKRRCQPQRSFTHPLTTRVRSFIRRLQGHIPRVVVFGSGLESLPFVRTLMWEASSPYRPIGLSPGKDGVGSGVCVQHKETAVNLITLYSAPKSERGQGAVNKLLSSSSGGSHELTPAVQDLCQQADAFILIVDSTLNHTDTPCPDSKMLSSMLSCGPGHSPVLVLACQLMSTDQPLPPVDIAEHLQLELIDHPWQVRSLVIETYNGMEDGMDWLLKAGL